MFYYPLVARPFRHSDSYRELLPSPALRPYIRCFWGGMDEPAQEGNDGAVIPDTCVDLIYHINESDGSLYGGFAGISDHVIRAHAARGEGNFSTFGIRFYAWSACCFAEDALSGTLNGHLEAGDRFPGLDEQLLRALPHLPTLEARAAFAERLLLEHLASHRKQPLLDEAVARILQGRGSLDIARLAREMYISTRQLERIFQASVGTSPKRLSGLIRYQMVWQDALRAQQLDLPELVVKYGFTDEAHLMHEFKRYHDLDLRTARHLALENVGNIQDR